MKLANMIFALVGLILLSNPAFAADTKKDLSEKEKKFKESLTNVKLIGSFTIDGMKDGKLREEEYTISRVRKHEDKDAWVFWARIKYGKNNYAVPLKITVKWADDTPMITLDDFKILGQGPFGARVLFYDKKYSGTWSHGKVGGHMFGRIEKIEKEDAEKATEDAKKKAEKAKSDSDNK